MRFFKMERRIVKITEGQYRAFVDADDLYEDVYASGKRGKNKIQLSYNKRNSTNRTRNIGSLNSAELLNTGKMDQNNADTFEVPLKGGIMSYNITSIRGTEIMHYFKNKHAKMNVDLDGDGQKESYDLWMDDPEYRAFFDQFFTKVNHVITNAMGNFKGEDGKPVNFSGVSIYPVPSSSDFNEKVAGDMAGRVKINGLNVVKINSGMFKKDLSDLQKDEDFINKNKSYYQGRMYKKRDDDTTHEEYVDKVLKDYGNTESIRKNVAGLIDEYNQAYKKLFTCYQINRNRYGDRFPEALAGFYKELSDKLDNIYSALKQGRINAIDSSQIYQKLKGTRSPSEERNTENIWKIVKPYLRGTGIKKIIMHKLEPKDFQIKSLPNNVRMGFKNYFKGDDEVIQQEMEKIKDTVFVIFDDNISGGATLSDICMHARQIGINYIIPITFGEMQQKYSFGPGLQINKPSKDGRFQNY